MILHFETWKTTERGVPRTLNRILRGVSQVILVDNAASGGLILVSLFVGSGIVLGTTALVTTLAATIFASHVFTNTDSVRQGLAGYNACLVGCAFSVFVSTQWDAWKFISAISIAVTACTLDVSLKAALGSVPTFTLAVSECLFVMSFYFRAFFFKNV